MNVRWFPRLNPRKSFRFFSPLSTSETTMKYCITLALLLCALVTLFCASPLLADDLGTVNSVSQTECVTAAGSLPGACYALNVSCPNISTFTVYIKVWSHPASLGTVLLTTNGGGTSTYEREYTYGSTVVSDLHNAGFTTVETSFGYPFSNTQPNGWLTGPGGPRALACRYATTAFWVYQNIQANSAIPLCATGNSAGSQVIGESLAHYNLGSILSLAEETSGPPYQRIDMACISPRNAIEGPCGPKLLPQLVGLGDAEHFVDPAYPGPWCSEAMQYSDSTHASRFLYDSVTSRDAVLNYPGTFVNFLFGDGDYSSAPVMGHQYYLLITSPASMACVSGAVHNIADSVGGANQIVADITTHCKLPAASVERLETGK